MVVTYTASGIFKLRAWRIAMIAAFTYWDLRIERHWAAPLAFAAVLPSRRPVMGRGHPERVVMRDQGGAAPITNIVVTIGLLVTLLGIGSVVWAPSKFFTVTPSLLRFFQADVVTVVGAPIPWHYFIVLGNSAAVAFGLWTLLAGTRIGIAMRAVVDDRNLARLNGENPDVASTVSWVVGCMLAALAGILLAPILRAADVARLTLLVISAYAVAVVGRLRSLPLTALGAVILGLALSTSTGCSARWRTYPCGCRASTTRCRSSCCSSCCCCSRRIAPGSPTVLHTRWARPLCRPCARRWRADRSVRRRSLVRRGVHCMARSSEQPGKARARRSSCCRSWC